MSEAKTTTRSIELWATLSFSHLPFFQLPGSADDVPGGRRVALEAYVEQRGPTDSHQPCQDVHVTICYAKKERKKGEGRERWAYKGGKGEKARQVYLMMCYFLSLFIHLSIYFSVFKWIKKKKRGT